PEAHSRPFPPGARNRPGHRPALRHTHAPLRARRKDPPPRRPARNEGEGWSEPRRPSPPKVPARRLPAGPWRCGTRTRRFRAGTPAPARCRIHVPPSCPASHPATVPVTSRHRGHESLFFAPRGRPLPTAHASRATWTRDPGNGDRSEPSRPEFDALPYANEADR